MQVWRSASASSLRTCKSANFSVCIVFDTQREFLASFARQIRDSFFARDNKSELKTRSHTKTQKNRSPTETFLAFVRAKSTRDRGAKMSPFGDLCATSNLRQTQSEFDPRDSQNTREVSSKIVNCKRNLLEKRRREKRQTKSRQFCRLLLSRQEFAPTQRTLS